MFKHLNVEYYDCPVCKIDMRGRQPGRATKVEKPRAENSGLRMPHYEVESQGWIQDKWPTKHLS